MAPMPGWLVETWIEYALAMTVALGRLVLRTRLYGLKGWQGDDYLVVVAIISYTINTMTFQLEEYLNTNSHLTQAMVDEMTTKEIDNMVLGSIWHFVSFYSWPGLLWSSKGCMLFLYSRLTMGLRRHMMVKITAWICGLTFFGALLTNTFKCGLPISRNWQVVPPPGPCPAGGKLYLYIGPINFVTDVLILSIPVPILRKVNLPLRKRILLYCLFGSGFIIVIISALRTIFSLLALYNIGANASNLGFRLAWSSREVFTSLIIVNVPVLFSCLQTFSRHSFEGGSGSWWSGRSNRKPSGLPSSIKELDFIPSNSNGSQNARSETFCHNRNASASEPRSPRAILEGGKLVYVSSDRCLVGNRQIDDDSDKDEHGLGIMDRVFESKPERDGMFAV